MFRAPITRATALVGASLHLACSSSSSPQATAQDDAGNGADSSGVAPDAAAADAGDLDAAMPGPLDAHPEASGHVGSDGAAPGTDAAATCVKAPAVPPGAIPIQATDDPQSIIDQHPAGTTYVFATGIHRLQQFTGHSGDIYVGFPGTIFSGAALVTTFTHTGSDWQITGQTQNHGAGMSSTVCNAAHPMCDDSDDVFVDDKPLSPVGSLAALVSGTFYFDYGAQTIHLADDPTGHKVETSVLPWAVRGGPLTVENVVFEKYANQYHAGTVVGPDSGSTLVDVVARWNHNTGVGLSSGSTMTGGAVNDNGEQGAAASGADGASMKGVEMARNGWAGYECNNEAGGIKVAATNGFQFLQDYAHDNLCVGLWGDVNNSNMVFDHNIVVGNKAAGIQHEISTNATITNNVVLRNGAPNVSNAGIFLSSSGPMGEVSGNTVEVSPGSDGIVIQYVDRGGQQPVNAWNIHDNTVIYTGSSGVTGYQVCSTSAAANAWTPSFDHDTYYVTSATDAHWQYQSCSTFLGWQALQATGQEAHGTLVVQTRPPTPDPGVPFALCP